MDGSDPEKEEGLDLEDRPTSLELPLSSSSSLVIVEGVREGGREGQEQQHGV